MPGTEDMAVKKQSWHQLHGTYKIQSREALSNSSQQGLMSGAEVQAAMGAKSRRVIWGLSKCPSSKRYSSGNLRNKRSLV